MLSCLLQEHLGLMVCIMEHVFARVVNADNLPGKSLYTKSEVNKMVTETDMMDLMKFEIWIDGETMEEYFKEFGQRTESMGSHMWNKFVSHDHSILKLYCYADKDNRRIIAKMVNAWIKKYGKAY